MTTTQATAEVFRTAFRALPKAVRERFLGRLVSDPRIREDLMDIALIEERRAEKSRPFSSYVAERRPAHAAQ